MSVVTLLPFLLIGGAVFSIAAVSRSRRRTAEARAQRERAYQAALPPPTIALERQNALALEALDQVCALSDSVPGVFVDMESYFARRGWNEGDVFLIMGRLAGLGLAHQLVTANHPYSPYRYRATLNGVRENMANAGRGANASNISINQTTEQGDNTFNAAFGAGNASMHQDRRGEVRHVHQQLVHRLREDATQATQAEADIAESHAGNLESALAAGDTEARDATLGRIHRFLLTAGSAFQASQQLFSLLGLPGS
ncbi:hypothetical protein OG609_14415 [Streptomyces sp. NBC_01224]|uniref:hypothetical protein n=1 Tax=Streptomyces sp. NBC_01224 TaxID=2903783 RepID=UPI002E11F244|nr:hypothetical protein OG609_14415 [Streptomyces sp. NBC_01224]